MSDQSDQYGAAETKRRMEEGLRRALTSPHKPNSKLVGKSVKADSSKAEKPKKAKRKATHVER
jgi:hypothetical protein